MTYLATVEPLGNHNWRFTVRHTDPDHAALNYTAHEEVVHVDQDENATEKADRWMLNHGGFGIDPFNADHLAGWHESNPGDTTGLPTMHREVITGGALVVPVAEADREYNVTFTNALRPRMNESHTFPTLDAAMAFVQDYDNWPDYNNVRVRISHVTATHYRLGYASLQVWDTRREVYSMQRSITDYESPAPLYASLKKIDQKDAYNLSVWVAHELGDTQGREHGIYTLVAQDTETAWNKAQQYLAEWGLRPNGGEFTWRRFGDNWYAYLAPQS